MDANRLLLISDVAHAERDELILEVARILGVTHQPEGRAEQPADGAAILAALRDQRARSEALTEALRELLGKVGNIEVLGEWSALDMNHASQRSARKSIEATVAKARATLEKAGGA